ncbi:MAG: efflux RND transporter permease subunit [Candidatus Omnitrophota bacterium]|nr:efflux RND transporter permease subunit [Candidatus Omnitrophota bacterium]
MTLSDLSIKRHVFAWMLMLGLMSFGWISFQRLGISRLPDVDFPVVSVRVTWEGAAPEVMETDVVDVVEEALMSVQGIRDMSSSIRQGQASITVELELERDIDVAVQEIQTKLSQAQRRLPDDIDPPIVTKTNPEDQPIMWVTATSDIPLRNLMDYVDNHLEDQFATVNGVGEVFMGGFLERNLRVWIDAVKLNEHQLTVLDVITAIEQGHVERPAGRLETSTTERNVRAMGEALNVAEFENIPITRRGGQPIYKPIFIKDVATVEDGLADIRRISRTNGRQAVGLGMRKQRGVNEVAVGERILKRLEEIRKDVPEGIKLNLTVDRTKFVKQAIEELKFTLLLSALVTSVVCWLFLGSWTATINVLLAIPTSILGTFIFIYFLGFTLNTFTMLALSLAIGIVVDDAIMVLENIVRHREKGEERIEAARKGANQIAFAAMATTAAIIAIFLPVAFMSGVMGKYFFQFGLTISVAVAISLLEALTLTPMRCSQFLEVGEHQTWLGKTVDRGFKRLAAAYHDGLEWTLSRKGFVVIGSLAFFLASLLLVKFLNKEFVPPQDQSMFFCRLKTATGSSIDFTDEKFKEAEAFLQSRPEVARYFCAIGGFGGGEVNAGQIFVILKEPHERPVTPPYKRRPTQKDIMAYFRKEFGKIAGLETRIQDPSTGGLSGQRGYPIELTLLGPNRDKLIAFSEQMTRKMSGTGLMTDVDSDYDEGIPEIQVYPDRTLAMERGVDIESIARTVNAMIAGERVGRYTQGGRRYDVRVRLVPSQRAQAEDIQKLWVWNDHGELVQLKDLVVLKEKSTPTTINRRSRERAVTLHANVAPDKSQAQAIEAAQKIAKEILPEGYRAVFRGSTQTFQESFSSLSFVLWLGVLVAYMILASQFNGYKDPFIILLALPFSLSGAFLALWLTGQSLNIYSFIGIILLMGIVKKNSILLVEFTNQLRDQGKGLRESLLEACPMRLRPILMTSLATISAALPPAMALGPGAEALRPMAITVIGGMIVSTFFTLFVVPAVYSMIRASYQPREGEAA